MSANGLPPSESGARHRGGCVPAEHLVLRPVAGPEEFPLLVSVWRSAVQATHDFVASADLWEIEGLLAASYLPNVRVTVAEIAGRTVGFSGTANGRLEMMFVHNEFRGQGVGSALLAHVLELEDVVELDVNEQNEQAVSFYLARGFEVVGRAEVDEAGRPYPLLTMRRATSPG